MFPGVVGHRAAVASGAISTSSLVASGAMDHMASAKRPWRDYIAATVAMDAEPYPTAMNPKPTYQGRKRGKEGTLFKETVQLHYRRYPDEHVIAQLGRWRQGDVVDDIALQQFRGAQPFVLTPDNQDGFATPEAEEYLKLNYKNPKVLSKYLTRTGQHYPQSIMPLNPKALKMLRWSLWHAKRNGLYPIKGNPFWHRVQNDRPRPFEGSYNPVEARAKASTQHFAYNWLQTYRMRQFVERHRVGGATKADVSLGAAERSQQMTYADDAMPRGTYSDRVVGYSGATTTVPGLMSTLGLKKSQMLYSKNSQRRMGFPNPTNTKPI